jgi:hypothetical protein
MRAKIEQEFFSPHMDLEASGFMFHSTSPESGKGSMVDYVRPILGVEIISHNASTEVLEC